MNRGLFWLRGLSDDYGKCGVGLAFYVVFRFTNWQSGCGAEHLACSQQKYAPRYSGGDHGWMTVGPRQPLTNAKNYNENKKRE